MNIENLANIFYKKSQAEDTGIISLALRGVTEKFISEWGLTQKALKIVNEGTEGSGDFLENQKPILRVDGLKNSLSPNSGLVLSTVGSLLKDKKIGPKLVQLVTLFNKDLKPILEKELQRLNIDGNIKNVEIYIDNRQYFSI